MTTLKWSQQSNAEEHYYIMILIFFIVFLHFPIKHSFSSPDSLKNLPLACAVEPLTHYGHTKLLMKALLENPYILCREMWEEDRCMMRRYER